MLAIIPARANSKRIPHKNLKNFCGRPLFTWTVLAARQSDVFDAVVVSSDSREILAIADSYDGVHPLGRPARLAADNVPILGTIKHALDAMKKRGFDDSEYSILRPTNPFRNAETIKHAWRVWTWQIRLHFSSMRAISDVTEHPFKMWAMGHKDYCIAPLSDPGNKEHYNMATQKLPDLYIQNASLEMGWRHRTIDCDSISGTPVAGYIMDRIKGFDINTPDDWDYATWLVETGRVKLCAE